MDESQTDDLKNPNITEAKVVEAQGRTGAKTAWHSTQYLS